MRGKQKKRGTKTQTSRRACIAVGYQKTLFLKKKGRKEDIYRSSPGQKRALELQPICLSWPLSAPNGAACAAIFLFSLRRIRFKKERCLILCFRKRTLTNSDNSGSFFFFLLRCDFKHVIEKEREEKKKGTTTCIAMQVSKLRSNGRRGQVSRIREGDKCGTALKLHRMKSPTV